MRGRLYLIATPIGNLEDITLRAIRILAEVDVIACEDTRHSRKLLTHHGIKGKLVSCHEHNESIRAEEFAKLWAAGKSVALISDAGSPGISDPSYRLVRKATEIGVDVIPIPGPTAFVAAVTSSGLPSDAILFKGFLPSKKTERRKVLEGLRTTEATIVFYEAPHRLIGSLKDCLETLGDREAVVARELTKIHESFHRGPITRLIEIFTQQPPKGEIVLIIDRGQKEAGITYASIKEAVEAFEEAGLDSKSALKKVAKEFGISKSEAYRRLLSEK